VPEHKYQNEGGPSIKQCSSCPCGVFHPVIDLQSLLDAVIFNWLIGNNDAQARISLSFTVVEVSSDCKRRLAPLYI